MARAGLRCTGNFEAAAKVVDHPYYLKNMPMNPYIGAVYDGSSTAYRGGYVSKHMHHMYRFRYNLFPRGQTTGYYAGNKFAKHVHWLEVSTIERVRVQALGEEAIPMFWLSICVFSWTFYHFYRLCMQHKDGTAYLIAGPFMKHAVQMTRFSRVQELDEPIPYRLFQRVPEWTNYDANKELYKLEIAANDPFFDLLKKNDLMAEATAPSRDTTIGGYGDVKAKLFDPWSANKQRNEQYIP